MPAATDLPGLASLRMSFDGVVVTTDHPDYDTARRPVNAVGPERRPRTILRCRSTRDVAAGVDLARSSGCRVAVRGGGHCFAGRSSTEGVLLDLAGLDDVVVAHDGTATIGAGALLGAVYARLHAKGRTLPAGCGGTVGIAGLTLGGGIGLLGRLHGLTCDRLVGADVVLADGTVIHSDRREHADLFWALRGSGGAQFGVVTSLQFATVAEPLVRPVLAGWPADVDASVVVARWQRWAAEVPDTVTANLTITSGPRLPVLCRLAGVSAAPRTQTRDLIRDLVDGTGGTAEELWDDAAPYSQVKDTLDDPRDGDAPRRLRSEFFAKEMPLSTAGVLVQLLGDAAPSLRRLTFTAMGGAYNRVPHDSTAFAHRGERFLLEHVGSPSDSWVDRSWTAAHGQASGHVYPNFPDASLSKWAHAYHAGNHARLVEVKQTYDPHRFFDFPQAV